jgi:endo-1,4-beta-xylanase
MLDHIISLVTMMTLLLVTLLTSAVLLLRARTRRTGLWILSAFAVLGAALGWNLFYPHTFEKHYSSSPPNSPALSLRRRADAAGFFLGAAGDGTTLADPLFASTFNSMTPDNALKLDALLFDGRIGTYDFSRADAIVNRARQLGLRVRGHTLIWGKASDLFKSPDLDSYLRGFPRVDRSRILRDLVHRHITTVLTHFKGRIGTWDVVNEPLYMFWSARIDDNVFFRYLGSEYIADTFRIARGVDSTAKLYLNEQLESFTDARAEAFFKLAQHLKQEGVPIDGVGLQSHFGFVLPSRQEFRAFLARLTALGLEVEITELDARLALFRGTADPYRAQADYYGQLLGTCLENPGCKGLTFWGFTDDHCWMDSFALFPKPNEPYLFDAHRIPKPAVGALDSVFSEHARDGQTGRSRQDEGALP